jgi:diguanylate cyclase (GGDEF)-like protein
MFPALPKLPILSAILASIAAILAVTQFGAVVVEGVRARDSIKTAAMDQATASLDMLEALHVQSMLNRRETADGDPAIETLNGSMAQFSDANENTRLWVFMGPQIVAYQAARGSDEIELPADQIDRDVLASAKPQTAFDGEVFRLSRPVVLGAGHASNARCASCHTDLMGTSPGEVLGGYGAAVDTGVLMTRWREGLLISIAWAVLMTASTVFALGYLLRHWAMRPLQRLVDVTSSLAHGDTNITIEHSQRNDEVGDLAQALVVFRQNLIAKRELEEERDGASRKLEFMAWHDPLTQLPNRLRFAQLLAAGLELVQAGDRKLAVMLIDLDHFKDFNDSFGHAFGDAILCAVSERITRVVGSKGYAARLSGDEFAIAYQPDTDAFDVDLFCGELLYAFAEQFDIAGRHIAVSISFGVATAPCHGVLPEILLKSADLALYTVKSGGRKNYRVYTPEMNALIEERRWLERELNDAFERRQFELHYQPLVDCVSGKIAGVEALLRWHHPERGWINPATFIPVAESTGLIIPLGKWILETACKQVMHWPGVTLSVNVSPVQFRDRNFVTFVTETLKATGLEAVRLEIEITEGVLLENNASHLAALRALKDIGVRMAIDDFGTGFSSLAYLQSFPFDKIKIDQSFVRALENDHNALTIVKAVIGLGQSLGVTTTAEGVETDEQRAYLEANGCNQMQGFLLARPQNALRLTALLGAWPAGPRREPTIRPAELLAGTS